MAGKKLKKILKSPTQMAVDSDSVSKQKVSRKDGIKSPKPEKSKYQKHSGGEVCDSVNAKTCHQCRQKIRDISAACKAQRKNKPCTLIICHKCLLNRYGETAEEVANLADWSCPKCRGICNCSICMKRRGCQPTGQLSSTAKATGFSSVSDILRKGAIHLNHGKLVPDWNASPMEQQVVSVSPRKRGKENSFDGKIDTNLFNSVEKNSLEVDAMKTRTRVANSSSKGINQGPHKRLIEEGVNDLHVYKKNGVVLSDEIDSRGKKTISSKCGRKHNHNNGNGNLKESNFVNGKEVNKIRTRKLEENGCSNNSRAILSAKSHEKLDVPKDLVGSFMCEKGKEKVARINKTDDFLTGISLPLGTELTSVAGIDVRAHDAGNALQFVEFCDVFGKVLGIKKGEPQSALRDLSHGRARRGKFSLSIQFHIHLLTIISNDRGEKHTTLSASYGKNYWFDALRKCLSVSRSSFTAEELDFLRKAADYDTLDSSQKLRVLNLLCDEVLGTEKLRSWIGSQKLAEKFKEAKQKVKDFKQKMNDDIAKIIATKDGIPLSISEYEAIISRTKSEEGKIHAKMLEAQEMLSESASSAAVRIEPIFIGRDGDAYWKLNSAGESNILHQSVGRRDTPTQHEKWYAVDDVGKEAIENLVSLSEKRQKRRKVSP